MADTTTARPACWSPATCRCTEFAPRVAPVCGQGAVRQRGHERLVDVRRVQRFLQLLGRVTPSASRAVVVARMPARHRCEHGVNDTVTCSPAAPVSACSISACCGRRPPLYGESCP